MFHLREGNMRFHFPSEILLPSAKAPREMKSHIHFTKMKYLYNMALAYVILPTPREIENILSKPSTNQNHRNNVKI